MYIDIERILNTPITVFVLIVSVVGNWLSIIIIGALKMIIKAIIKRIAESKKTNKSKQ